jgi:hypothetical protein
MRRGHRRADRFEESASATRQQDNGAKLLSVGFLDAFDKDVGAVSAAQHPAIVTCWPSAR